MAQIRRQYVQTPLGQVLVRSGGSGKPVFLIANTYLTSEAFMRRGFFEKMADRYHTISADALGQGESDLPDHRLSVQEHAQNLADVMDALGIARASFVGSHTGASVALELAVSQPDRVDALVFAGLPMWNAEEREKLKTAFRFRPWEITPDGSYLDELWKRRLPITHGLTPDEMHWQFMAFLRPGPRVHEPLHSLFDYEPRDRLPLLKARLLTLASERDQFKEQMHEIVAVVPGTQTAIVPAGTLVHALDPEAFLATLSSFLN